MIAFHCFLLNNRLAAGSPGHDGTNFHHPANSRAWPQKNPGIQDPV